MNGEEKEEEIPEKLQHPCIAYIFWFKVLMISSQSLFAVNAMFAVLWDESVPQ